MRKVQHLPVYRALYMDKMLEEYNELAANCNASMRSLLRSFRTIRDADYEVPSSLTDILRPYQVYGFQWLSVLAHTGFGGILADEMGLEKHCSF